MNSRVLGNKPPGLSDNGVFSLLRCYSVLAPIIVITCLAFYIFSIKAATHPAAGWYRSYNSPYTWQYVVNSTNELRVAGERERKVDGAYLYLFSEDSAGAWVITSVLSAAGASVFWYQFYLPLPVAN